MDGEIDPETVEAAIESGDPPRIVDIREPGAFARGRIPGSENLPLGDLTGDIERLDGVDHVVTVCPHGEASVQAARLVAAYEGFDGTVESLAGGLAAWEGPIEGGRDSDVESPSPDADEPEAPF